MISWKDGKPAPDQYRLRASWAGAVRTLPDLLIVSGSHSLDRARVKLKYVIRNKTSQVSANRYGKRGK